METQKMDRRSERTRQALLGAFLHLFSQCRYDRITIAALVDRANVGRSTFYEHYKNKEGLLADSIKGPFGALADLAGGSDDPNAVERALDHIWLNRAQGRLIFGSAARRAVARALSAMICARMSGGRFGVRIPIKMEIAARALAEAELGILNAWLSGEITCPSADLAEVLKAAAQSFVVRSDR